MYQIIWGPYVPKWYEGPMYQMKCLVLRSKWMSLSQAKQVWNIPRHLKTFVWSCRYPIKAGMEYSAPLEDIRLVLSLPHRNITSLCGARNSYVARHVYLYSFGLVATAKECLVSRRISRATQGRTIPCHVEIFIWPCRCPIQAHHCGRNSQKSTVKLFCIVIWVANQLLRGTIYMFVYLCVYILRLNIWTYKYTYIHVYTYICIHICIYIHIYIYICIYKHIYIYIYVCIYTYVYIYMYTYIYKYKYVYIYMYIYVYIYIYIYIYIYTYIYVYTYIYI